MSFYLVVLFVLVVTSAVSFSSRYERFAYGLSITILSVMLVIRFGQGTDWFGYSYLFSRAPSVVDIESAYYTDAYHGEFLWKLFNNVIKSMNLGFLGVTIPVAIMEMGLTHLFLKKHVSNRSLGLLILYPTIYLTYFFSALRQGVIIAVFLGLMLDWLKRKEYLRYIVCTLVLAGVHNLSLVLLVPVLFMRLPRKSIPALLLVSALFGALGVYWLGPLMAVLGNAHYTSSSISLVALGYRVLTALLIYFTFQASKDSLDEESYSNLDLLLVTYLFGLALYFLTMTNSLVSGRLTAQFLALDAALLPALLSNAKLRTQVLCFIVVVLLASVMTVKNIDSYISQGSYYASVDVLNYPYVTIFNQEDIYSYRSSRYMAFLT